MTFRKVTCIQTIHLLAVAALLQLHPLAARSEAPPGASAAFDAYAGKVEARIAGQHNVPAQVLAPVASDPEKLAALRRGELVIETLIPSDSGDLPGAMLHHWRGTAFVPGAKAADFDRLMRDFDSYPRHFAPQVVQAKVLSRQGDRLQATMRVRQRHVITVVLDTQYDISFARIDARSGYSISRSTGVSEIESAGTSAERSLDASHDHGFLWRLNTYWSWAERDGGLYMQIESISLSRSIPVGVGWAVRPFVESVPRESLEFTLRSARNALPR